MYLQIQVKQTQERAEEQYLAERGLCTLYPHHLKGRPTLYLPAASAECQHFLKAGFKSDRAKIQSQVSLHNCFNFAKILCCWYSVYLENPRESTGNLSEPQRKLNKLIAFKITLTSSDNIMKKLLFMVLAKIRMTPSLRYVSRKNQKKLVTVAAPGRKIRWPGIAVVHYICELLIIVPIGNMHVTYRK